MSWGLPVVATAVGGSVELVREGITGHLVAPGSPVALADRLAAVLEDGAGAAAMGAAGRLVAGREYTMDGMIRANEALYERLWKAKGAQAH